MLLPMRDLLVVANFAHYFIITEAKTSHTCQKLPILVPGIFGSFFLVDGEEFCRLKLGPCMTMRNFIRTISDLLKTSKGFEKSSSK